MPAYPPSCSFGLCVSWISCFVGYESSSSNFRAEEVQTSVSVVAEDGALCARYFSQCV